MTSKQAHGRQHRPSFILMPILMGALALSCNTKQEQKQGIDITEAADTYRYESPQGTIEGKEAIQNVTINLNNRFPQWRDNIGAAIDISIKNISKSHIAARGLARLFVFNDETKAPLFWSNIDIAYGSAAEPNVINVLSLPVGASKDFSIPILETKWESINATRWPDLPFYQLVQPGTYLMRFEFELYDESDNLIGTLLSNFIRFTTVPTGPK